MSASNVLEMSVTLAFRLEGVTNLEYRGDAPHGDVLGRHSSLQIQEPGWTWETYLSHRSLAELANAPQSAARLWFWTMPGSAVSI